jgi:hypothetical protein
MLRNIEEVLDEKRRHEEYERNFYMSPKNNHFPFTHGENVELGRKQIREELQRDLRNLQMLKEKHEREQLGDEQYEKMYRNTLTEDAVIDHETKLFP